MFGNDVFFPKLGAVQRAPPIHQCLNCSLDLLILLITLILDSNGYLLGYFGLRVHLKGKTFEIVSHFKSFVFDLLQLEFGWLQDLGLLIGLILYLFDHLLALIRKSTIRNSPNRVLLQACHGIESRWFVFVALLVQINDPLFVL